MKADGVPIDVISKYPEFSRKEVEKLPLSSGYFAEMQCLLLPGIKIDRRFVCWRLNYKTF